MHSVFFFHYFIYSFIPASGIVGSMVLIFLSEWGALIIWRGRAFGHSIQPPPGFWVRATERQGMQRVMYSPSVFFFLPHLPLYWPEWSLERTDWSNRTPNPRGSAELLTVLWWCHKSQSKHYGLHLNTQIIPFVCLRMNNMQFNLHGSACLAAALCSPYSNCEGCAVRSLLLCRVLQPTVTFQQTWVKRQMKSSQKPIVCSSYCLLKSHQAYVSC